jgi:hypothetical protein
MYRRLVFTLFTVLFVIFNFGCEPETPTIAPGADSKYFRGDIYAIPIHPKIGAGPGFLVSAFSSIDDLERGNVMATAVTDSLGRAKFTRIRTGGLFLTCRTATKPYLNGQIETFVMTDTLVQVEFLLK